MNDQDRKTGVPPEGQGAEESYTCTRCAGVFPMDRHHDCPPLASASGGAARDGTEDSDRLLITKFQAALNAFARWQPSQGSGRKWDEAVDSARQALLNRFASLRAALPSSVARDGTEPSVTEHCPMCASWWFRTTDTRGDSEGWMRECKQCGHRYEKRHARYMRAALPSSVARDGTEPTEWLVGKGRSRIRASIPDGAVQEDAQAIDRATIDRLDAESERLERERDEAWAALVAAEARALKAEGERDRLREALEEIRQLYRAAGTLAGEGAHEMLHLVNCALYSSPTPDPRAE